MYTLIYAELDGGLQILMSKFIVAGKGRREDEQNIAAEVVDLGNQSQLMTLDLITYIPAAKEINSSAPQSSLSESIHSSVRITPRNGKVQEAETQSLFPPSLYKIH